GLEEHSLWAVPRVQEGRDDLQPLDRLVLLLALGALDRELELGGLRVEVDLLEEIADRFRTHAATEVVAPAERRAEPVLHLPKERFVGDHVLDLHLLELLPGLTHALGGVLDVGLCVGDVLVEQLAQVLLELLAVGVGELLDVDLERVGPEVVLVVEARLLSALEVLEPAVERLTKLE